MRSVIAEFRGGGWPRHRRVVRRALRGSYGRQSRAPPFESLTASRTMPGSATAHHPPFGQASLARVRLVSCSHPRSSRYAELLCILRVQSLPAAELHRVGTDDAADGRSAEQVIQNVEADVPPGGTIA